MSLEVGQIVYIRSDIPMLDNHHNYVDYTDVEVISFSEKYQIVFVTGNRRDIIRLNMPEVFETVEGVKEFNRKINEEIKELYKNFYIPFVIKE